MNFTLRTAAVALALFVWADVHATGPYTLTILENHGNVPGTRSVALGISPKGTAVGQSLDSRVDDRIAAVRWINGVAEALPTIGTGANTAKAANDGGDVIGTVSLTPPANGVPVLWRSDGTWVLLEPLGIGGQSSAGDINKKGQIVGSSQKVAGGADYAVNWRKGAPPVEYPSLPTATSSAARAVALNGWVAGYTFLESREQHATIWKDRVPQDIGTLGGLFALVNSINDSGQAVGWSSDLGENYTRPFLWSGGSMTELATLDGTNAWAVGINNKGVAVGYGSFEGDLHAMMWRDGKTIDLNDKLDADSKAAGWVLQWVSGVDERGQVLGMAHNTVTQIYRPFILSP